MLKASPPHVSSYGYRSCYRDMERGEIAFGKASKASSKALIDSVKATHKTDVDDRQELRRRIRQVIVSVSMPFIRFRDNSWHDDIDPAKIRFPRWAKPLLTSGFVAVDEKRRDLLSDVANEVFKYLPPELLGAEDDANNLRTVVESVAKEFFSEVFKGAGK